MKTIGATLALALVSLLILSAFRQGGPGGLRGQVIQGCEIDVRPVSKPEAQIYYRELTTAPTGQQRTSEDLDSGIYGSEFDLRVGADGKLEIGTGDALMVVPAKAGGPNLIHLTMNTNKNPIEYRLTIQWPAQVGSANSALDAKITGGGAFDLLGGFQDPPTVETVRRDDGDGKKGRIRITAKTRGVSLAFTVGDA